MTKTLPQKECRTCKQSKPLDEYRKYSTGNPRPDCIACQYKYQRKWRAAHPESTKRSSDGYYQRNIEKMRAKHLEYNAANRGKCNEATARWKRSNPGKAKAYVDAYRASHTQALNAKHNARMAKSPEQKIAHMAVYNAVQDGRLLKPEGCSQCDRAVHLVGHHEDYSRLLDVMWLCRRCHADIHGRTKWARE